MKIGTTTITDCKFGTAQINKVYHGTNLIWEKAVAKPTISMEEFPMFTNNGTSITCRWVFYLSTPFAVNTTVYVNESLAGNLSFSVPAGATTHTYSRPYIKQNYPMFVTMTLTSNAAYSLGTPQYAEIVVPDSGFGGGGGLEPA